MPRHVTSKPDLGRVLVVDDDFRMRRICALFLQAEGWTVVLAENGQAAIDAMSGPEAFDCVVSDIQMPQLDGFGLVAAVRRYDDDLPVLLMTGDPTLDGAVRAINSGAVSYLAKPFNQEALASAVARAARRHGLSRMRRRAESFAQAGSDGMSDVVDRYERALARSWMVFQPIVNVRERKVFAYEALIRTDEPSMVRPDVLIATGERLGRIHDLGRVVRSAVARAAVDLPPDVLLFVNVHGLELTDEELYRETALLAYVPRVVLEITERIGFESVDGSTRIAMLRKLGYQIAIDDLGAGYAALGALASLTPEIVKLDMSLTRDMPGSTRMRQVLGAIVTLVRDLGALVIAEGVETEVERDAVMAAGIDLMQGWHFARPAREFATPAGL